MKPSKEILFGTGMAQARGTIAAFVEFFRDHQFTQIIELGTGRGSLSTFFAYCQYITQGKFYTYEIKHVSRSVVKLIVGLSGKVYSSTDLWEIKRSIKVAIQRSGPTLVLCDNGNKIKEVQAFGPILKSGDFIMAHDFWPEGRTSDAWWCEITLADIAESMEKENIVRVHEDLFDPVFWFCGRKK